MSLFRSAGSGGASGAQETKAGSADEASEEVSGKARSVTGERGISSINRARPLQARVTNALAIGLMGALGLGLLGWYYAHAFARQAEGRRSAQAASRRQAQGDLPLPSLGPIDPPTAPARPAASVVQSALGPAPPVPPTLVGAQVAGSGEASPPATISSAAGGAAAATKSPRELALERKLSGPAFDSQSDSSASSPAPAPAAGLPTGAAGPESPSPAQGAQLPAGRPADNSLQTLLIPSVTPAARPTVLPTQRLLLPKGAFIDCTLETAIDSTLPGMTTCVTATDTFGADGTTVLMERGTKLVGETRGEVQQGSARVFVLWTEARTPTGVVIPLASPGTDELGRSGLGGTVNRHFWQRFGAAILISMINGGEEYAVQSQAKGGTVIYDPGATQGVLTEALRGTVDIPPTVTVANGSRIQVLVARDLDFRSVYELKPTAQR